MIIIIITISSFAWRACYLSHRTVIVNSYVGNDTAFRADQVTQWNYYARQFIQIRDRARKNLVGDVSSSLAVDLVFPVAYNDDEMLSE